jgi:glutathione S-transferase
MPVKVVTEASDVPHQPIDGKPTLVYWNILGLVQASRLALVCAKVDFYDVRMDPGEDRVPPTQMKVWAGSKPRVQEVMPFPNLPYYLDDQVQLSQSNTILRYLGHKHNLMGSAPHRTDMALDQLSDVEGQFASRCYFQGPDAVLEWYRTQVPHILSQFVQLLGNQDFIGGSSPSVADCKFYAFLHKLNVAQDQLGNDETAGIMPSSLKEYMRRFESVPAMQEYMASSNYLKGPLNNVIAKFLG